ncbi:Protein involved in cell division [Serratia rubidaea]|nr:Fic family protein [Serratia rubidaea]QPR62389.1 Fic family protein [Serratia rubidaea]CAI0850059.1 Protein involved in cell division [Serratia rubidaea]CAI1656350.1 Protein involved in cell division [Serratia rubidaea]HAY0639226.1 Fic family protein [Serratia rubidaea]
MRVTPPPKLNITDVNIDSPSALVDKYHQITDKYLHYDELRHRVRQQQELDSMWFVINLTRTISLKRFSLLALAEDENKPGISTTGVIQRSCSIVDRLTSSAAEAERYEEFDAGDYLMAELVAAESIASSQLEGAATTSRVALEMIKVGRLPRDESEKMIMGNYRMMNFVAEHAGDEVTLDYILELHRVAVVGVNDDNYAPGQFRQGEDNVAVVDLEGNVIHTPPPAAQLQERLTRLCEFINTPHETYQGEKYLHPLVKSSIIHFMMGYLHPFRDGNGRSARALFYAYMLKCGYTAFRYISISKLLKNAPAQYVKSYLYTETDGMDLTYFVNYQSEIIARAVQEYIDYIRNIIRTREELTRWFYRSGLLTKLNGRQRDIVLMAISQPGVLFSASEIAERMGVAENTARDDLKKLAELGIMRVLKEGKGKVYTSPKSIRDLKKWHQKKNSVLSTQDW